ncbi:MAG: hypothetical protein ACI9W6_002826 [Motiliproteus sp.]
MRRYEIQPEADRFGFMWHVPVPHPSGNLRLCKSAILPICLPQTVNLAIPGSTLRAFSV